MRVFRLTRSLKVSDVISFLPVVICPFLIITPFLGRYISEISDISLPSKAFSYQFRQTNHKKVSIFSVHIMHFLLLWAEKVQKEAVSLIVDPCMIRLTFYKNGIIQTGIQRFICLITRRFHFQRNNFTFSRQIQVRLGVLAARCASCFA